MYTTKPYGVLTKSEDELRKERHAATTVRAEHTPQQAGCMSAGKRRMSFRFKPPEEWEGEDYLLLMLILWQLCLPERDYLLLLALVFVLLSD